MRIENIDELIKLVEKDSFSDKVFVEIVWRCLGVRCLLPPPITLKTRLKHLKQWKAERKSFFVDDPFANRVY